MNYSLYLLLLISISAFSQGVQLNTEAAQESYILFSNRDSTFLIDNCGGVLQEWPYGRTDMHHHSKLLEDGTLIFIRSLGVLNKRIEEYSYDGELIAIIEEKEPNIILHYEVIKMSNGNYLTIGREVLSQDEIKNLGYDISQGNPSYMDMILELNPEGDIVWQWNIKDHIIQQRDPTMSNYGIVSDHPELLNMDIPLSSVDWSNTETFMINGFDYNQELDQIIISIRKMGEIAIIDHSTTTEEAAGHTGGNYGKGGDIIWRWGNPNNYGAEEERFLYYQHNPKWIESGPYKNMITCFNNGLGRPGGVDNRFSQIPIIDTKLNNGVYSFEDGQYSKNGLQKVYDKNETNTDFYSSYTSGAEILPNGNIHITVGQEGRMFEIDNTGEIVWDYHIRNSGYIFRSEKYPLDYSAFIGRDLTPKRHIESSYDCSLFTNTINVSSNISLYYSVSSDLIELFSTTNLDCYLYSIQGELLYRNSFINNHSINISSLTQGIYLLSFSDTNKSTKTIKIVK